jgi:protein-S-isoprenylcysteine O-methyltransferase Ste14
MSKLLRLQSGWPTLASILVWVLFSIYWEYAGRNSSNAQKSESEASRGIHIAMVSLAQLLLFFEPIRPAQRILPYPVTRVTLGLLMEVCGVALAVWARVFLGKHWSGRITIKVEHELIREGPYGQLRHPIYTGLLTMYLGAAVVSGESHAAAGLLLAVIAYIRKVRLEEAKLTEAFGEAYQEYQLRTWGLFPGLH